MELLIELVSHAKWKTAYDAIMEFRLVIIVVYHTLSLILQQAYVK